MSDNTCSILSANDADDAKMRGLIVQHGFHIAHEGAIDLSTIGTGFQIRIEKPFDARKVAEYAVRMESGSVAPMIVVTADGQLISGRHRFEARKALSDKRNAKKDVAVLDVPKLTGVTLNVNLDGASSAVEAQLRMLANDLNKGPNPNDESTVLRAIKDKLALRGWSAPVVTAIAGEEGRSRDVVNKLSHEVQAEARLAKDVAEALPVEMVRLFGSGKAPALSSGDLNRAAQMVTDNRLGVMRTKKLITALAEAPSNERTTDMVFGELVADLALEEKAKQVSNVRSGVSPKVNMFVAQLSGIANRAVDDFAGLGAVLDPSVAARQIRLAQDAILVCQEVIRRQSTNL